MGSIIRGSQTASDMLNGGGKCGNAGDLGSEPRRGRCGVGPRLPLLVISPWAKQNNVDNTFTDQASIPKFHRGQLESGAGSVGSPPTGPRGTLVNGVQLQPALRPTRRR